MRWDSLIDSQRLLWYTDYSVIRTFSESFPEGHMSISFRHSAGFGKRIEYKLIGDMLMEGLDCYTPLVDDHGVDCVIKKKDGTFIEIQIKASSKDVTEGDAALFSAIEHEYTPNYFIVFFSERLNMMWILSSEEFLT